MLVPISRFSVPTGQVIPKIAALVSFALKLALLALREGVPATFHKCDMVSFRQCYGMFTSGVYVSCVMRDKLFLSCKEINGISAECLFLCL